MKYIEERYSKKRCNQLYERISITSLILGLIVMIIGMAITLFNPYYEVGMAIGLLGLGIMLLGILILVQSSETLERRYKVIEEIDSE